MGFTGAGSVVTDFSSTAGSSSIAGSLPVADFLLIADSLSIVGFLSVTEGSAGGGCVFDSFAQAAILSLCSRIDLSKINSMDAARWDFSPDEELPMISKSVESSTDGFNFE